MDSAMELKAATDALDKARVALLGATKDYEQRRDEEREASRNTTAALSILHNAQKAFDTAVAKVRDLAPVGSTWHDRRGKGEVAV